MRHCGHHALNVHLADPGYKRAASITVSLPDEVYL
jgi:hypothetical protein